MLSKFCELLYKGNSSTIKRTICAKENCNKDDFFAILYRKCAEERIKVHIVWSVETDLISWSYLVNDEIYKDFTGVQKIRNVSFLSLCFYLSHMTTGYKVATYFITPRGVQYVSDHYHLRSPFKHMIYWYIFQT